MLCLRQDFQQAVTNATGIGNVVHQRAGLSVAELALAQTCQYFMSEHLFKLLHALLQLLRLHNQRGRAILAQRRHLQQQAKHILTQTRVILLHLISALQILLQVFLQVFAFFHCLGKLQSQRLARLQHALLLIAQRHFNAVDVAEQFAVHAFDVLLV